MNKYDTDFMRFVRKLENELQNFESEYITLRAVQRVGDADGGALYEIIPQFNGYSGDDMLDKLMIDIEPDGYVMAYQDTYIASIRDENIVAEGESFSKIYFNCFNWLKETIDAIYSEMPDDSPFLPPFGDSYDDY